MTPLSLAVPAMTAGGLLAGFVSVIWGFLSEEFFDRCVGLAAGDRALAARLMSFFARRAEYRLVLRFLLLLALALVLLPWLWPVAGTASGEGSAMPMWPLVAIPAACWLLVDAIAPVLPAAFAVFFLRLSLPVIEGARRVLLVPLVWPVMQWRRSFRRRGAAPAGTSLEDEIRGLVQQRLDAAGENRHPGADEHRMIRGILDLGRTPVREIMTPRVDVDAVEDTATIAEMRAKIIEHGHSRLPVYRGTIDHVVGIVHAKDLLHAAEGGLGSPADLLRPPVFIPETKGVAALLREFQEGRNHFAVVLDEYGGTAGIVTLEDAMEEIVGEIRDEYDSREQAPDLRRLADGSVVADGRIAVAALAERTGWDLPQDSDYETLGGLITTVLGRIPAKGEVVNTGLFRFEVLEADQRRVLQVRTTRNEPPPDDGSGAVHGPVA